MLKRVYVDNYRCLVNFDCQLAAKQLILGPNGGGKTTLFNVLTTLRNFCFGGLPGESLFLGDTPTRWQNISTQTFELEVTGNEGHYIFKLVIDSWGQPTARPRVVKEEVFYSGKPIFQFVHGEVHLFNDQHQEKVTYPFDWFRSALATITERPENKKLSWFKNWLGGLLLIMPEPRQMWSLAGNEAPVPEANLSNFAAWYRHVRLESGDQKLVEDLREAIPGLESMDLKDAGLGNRLLMLTCATQSANGRPTQAFPPLFFHELSDSQRVLVGLYTVLHFALKSGATVCFDEPDNFIALKEIQPWLEKLLDKVDEEPNAQVLIISHHPELLNRMAFEGGIVLDRPGGRHTRAQPFSDPLQTGLSPAELVGRGWENE
jgi:predicted ATPase